jgi:Flp pilus assembly protein TadG
VARRGATRMDGRRGSAAVEFALVGPIFVLLLMGMVVYGGWFWLAQSVQSLASEGARAAVAGLDAAERELLARQSVQAGLRDTSALPQADVRVNVLSDDERIVVEVAYDASNHPLMLLARLVPPPPLRIARTAVVRTGGA